MIAKIMTGYYVIGMVNYNHDKTNDIKKDSNKAIILDVNNILSLAKKDIIKTISMHNSLNKNISKPNLHISISFHKDDILDNETIQKIGEEYMQKMNYGEQPYAIYRHFDKEHPHIHIISTQINNLGKKINDSHIYRRSHKISRDIELKYGITQAVKSEKQLFNKDDIEQAVNEHLEEGKHSLTEIMRRIIYESLLKKPTSMEQFDFILKELQLIRIEKKDDKDNNIGHYFDLRKLENLNDENKFTTKNNCVNGYDLDPLLSYEKIKITIDKNKIEKDNLLKNIMGRTYSIINPIETKYKQSIIENISKDKIPLSELIINLKKKGIDLIEKRSQTGDNPNSLYGLVFKDINSNISFTASELKLKTKDFLAMVVDDLKDNPELIKKVKNYETKKNDIFSNEIYNNSKKDKNSTAYKIDALDDLIKLFSNVAPVNKDNLVAPKNKRKKRRL